MNYRLDLLDELLTLAGSMAAGYREGAPPELRQQILERQRAGVLEQFERFGIAPSDTEAMYGAAITFGMVISMFAEALDHPEAPANVHGTIVHLAQVVACMQTAVRPWLPE